MQLISLFGILSTLVVTSIAGAAPLTAWDTDAIWMCENTGWVNFLGCL
jgi:hypothetical protein